MTSQNTDIPTRADAASEKREKRISLAKNLSFSAAFAALCCVSTMFLHIPQPAGGSGYSNLGDIFSLLSGWFLGPLYGAAAAGFGGMLADILLGSAVYAPATFAVKALMSAAGYLIWAALKRAVKSEKFDFAARFVAALAAESIMVVGYFLYEGFVLGLGLGAAANILYNVFQGLTGLIGAEVLVAALYPVKSVRRLFPRLIARRKQKRAD